MTANVLWDEFRAATGRRVTPAPPQVEERRPGAFAFLASGEVWLTFAVLTLGLMAVVYSIESTNWVREMPSLVVAGLVGLITGWLLAHVRTNALPLHVVGIASGLTVAVGQTLHTMRLEDPLLQSGPRARWSEMWARVGEWVRALVEGGISTDPLPFVLMVVFGVWAMSYLAAWSIFRWRNAWLALIPAGFALLTNISYLPEQPAGGFILFLFAAILLVTRMHYLQALREWREQHAWLGSHLSLEVLNFSTWIGLALILFAWIVPTANNWGPMADAWTDALRPVSDRVDRFGRLFIGVGSKRDHHIHTFGDTLPLQGKVKLDDEEVLLRVVAPEPFYLRGAVYDEYTAQGWKVSDATTRPLLGTSIDAAALGTPQTRSQLRRPVAIEVTVERSVTSRRLFSVGDPLTSDVEARLLTSEQDREPIGLVPDSRVRDGDTYSTVGTVSAATVETLRDSGRNYPQAVQDRYLQIPDDLSPEVVQLAQDLAGDLEEPYAIARRVESFLRDQYVFDLGIADPPPRRDAVAYFLFDARRGYFDHYASAMAVLLRTLDVPARVVTGFALDDADFDSDSNAYLVTESRAWTWPEVYFEGLGWVEFNPTPGQPLIQRSGDDSEFVGTGDLTGEELLDLDALFADALSAFGGAGLSAGDSGGILGASIIGTIVAAALAWLSAAAVVVFVLWAGARGLWSYWFRGLRPAAGRWAKLQQLAVWAGAPVRVNRTPLESVERFAEVVGDDLDLRPLADAYTRERYGRAVDDVDESEHEDEDEDEAAQEEADRLGRTYVESRNRLLRRIARRPFSVRTWLPGREQVAEGP